MEGSVPDVSNRPGREAAPIGLRRDGADRPADVPGESIPVVVHVTLAFLAALLALAGAVAWSLSALHPG